MIWPAIEAFSNLFYQPLVFWGAPLLLALVVELRHKR